MFLALPQQGMRSKDASLRFRPAGSNLSWRPPAVHPRSNVVYTSRQSSTLRRKQSVLWLRDDCLGILDTISDKFLVYSPPREQGGPSSARVYGCHNSQIQSSCTPMARSSSPPAFPLSIPECLYLSLGSPRNNDQPPENHTPYWNLLQPTVPPGG